MGGRPRGASERVGDGVMFLTIVIPTCDRTLDLGKCLGRVVPQAASFSDGAEIIVTDDGTTSATREMIARDFPSARWNAGPRRGPAANRNAGAACGSGKWILFLDDDCLPRDGIVAEYAGAMKEADQRVVFYGPTFAEASFDPLVFEAPANENGEQLISCNFGISRALFGECGGFDDRYPMAAFEDTDLEARLRRMDTSIRFLPRAAVDHPLRKRPSALKLARRWEARVISTHDLGASPLQIAVLLPRHVLLVILSRFRGRGCGIVELRAACAAAIEFLIFLVLLPGWMFRWCGRPRGTFWKHQASRGDVPPKFGL